MVVGVLPGYNNVHERAMYSNRERGGGAEGRKASNGEDEGFEGEDEGFEGFEG